MTQFGRGANICVAKMSVAQRGVFGYHPAMIAPKALPAAGKAVERSLLVLLLVGLAPAVEAKAEPPRIIFDTDLGADADDLGALAMLLHYEAAGDAHLLGVMSWSNERHAIPAIDAVLRWYGQSEVPLGVRKVPAWDAEWHHSRQIAERFGGGRSGDEVPNATLLYRQLLAGEPDHAITIVAVGPLANLRDLLDSPPDVHSPLTGRELIHRKVARFVIMGGHFPHGTGEWNFNGEMLGVTRAVLAQIAVPIIFSGYEVGEAIRTGAILNDAACATPLTVGYRHFSEHAPWMKERFRGEILDNASFDQTAVLYAVRGNEGDWWEEISGGHVEVEENGDNRWIPGPEINQSYLRLTGDPEELARVIETAMIGVNPACPIEPATSMNRVHVRQ